MTLIPELKIGLLNTWLPILFFHLFVMIFSYLISKEGFKRGAERSWVGKKEKVLMMFSALCLYGMLIFSIWLPLKTGTALFYSGMIVYTIGLFFHSVASVNFVTAPPGKVITVGLYKISRNPIYLLNGIVMIGVSIAAACWLMLIITAAYWIIIHWIIKAEEKYCLKTYGEEYRKYMKKTARYFLFF